MLHDSAKELNKRVAKLFERKDTLNGLHQQIAELYYPERATFTSESSLGDEFASNLFDGSTVLARRDLGNAIAAALRPRGKQWFKLRVSEDRMEAPGVAEWLDSATERMTRFMYAGGSQFTRATKEADHDYAAFGNAVLSVEVNTAQNGLIYRDYHLRDCAWAENSEGEVDTLGRKMKMSARQLKQMFGESVLHRNVKQALEKEPDREFSIQHVMLPAEDYEYAKKPRVKMPFCSIYIDVENDEILREAGSWEFRYVTPRWQTIDGSPYAVSPAAMVGLPDGRGLQAMARIMLEAGEKSVDPPMIAQQGTIIGDMNLYAGGHTWVDKEYDERLGQPLYPIEMGKNMALGIDMLLRAQMAIKEAWYLNKLTLPPYGKTAYETAQLIEEYVRAAIPLFEPLETGYNEPLLDETASILIRQGAFGPPEQLPEALSGQALEFEFSNPVQDALEKNKANYFSGMMQLTMGDPELVATIDRPKAFRESTIGMGAPADWLLDQEQVEQQKAQADQMAAMMQTIQGAGMAAETVGKGADAAIKVQQVANAA